RAEAEPVAYRRLHARGGRCLRRHRAPGRADDRLHPVPHWTEELQMSDNVSVMHDEEAASVTPERSRRGAALLTALFGIVVISTIVSGAFFTSSQEFRGGRNQLVEQRAFAVAEYGLNAEVSNWDRGRNLPGGMAVGAVDSSRVYVAAGDT